MSIVHAEDSAAELVADMGAPIVFGLDGARREIPYPTPILRKRESARARRAIPPQGLVEPGTKWLQLQGGRFAIIDEINADLDQYTWTLVRRNLREYAITTITLLDGSRQQVQLHRVITGVNDPAILVDHRDGDGLNNRRSNLRISDHTENSHNITVRSGSKTGFLGVSKLAKSNRWSARIMKEGRSYNLGAFSTPEQANSARLQAEAELWGIQPRREMDHAAEREEPVHFVALPRQRNSPASAKPVAQDGLETALAAGVISQKQFKAGLSYRALLSAATTSTWGSDWLEQIHELVAENVSPRARGHLLLIAGRGQPFNAGIASAEAVHARLRAALDLVAEHLPGEGD